MDGELCCPDKDGRSEFNQLLFRHGQPYFYAFDLLWLNGRDLRERLLLRRKERLRGILPEPPAPILYTAHLDGNGVALFKAACQMDLEKIAAKRRESVYRCDERSADWRKTKNPQYSQIRRRHELFSQTHQ